MAQKRGDWRAVLPHVLANRLAAEGLNAIPPETVFRAVHSDRHLLVSFARRLGYLHDHEIARSIVESWLAPDGMLHEVETLDALHLRLLENVAPAAPVAVLDAIEARMNQLDPDHLPYVHTFQGAVVISLLCAIAYDADLFERSVRMLSRLVLSRKEEHRKGHSWNRLCGLFSLYLSGTDAPLCVRLPVVRRFLYSPNPIERDLGFGMVEAALDGGNRIGVNHVHFGSRPRTFGYWPGSVEERDGWFRSVLGLLSEAATSNDPALSSSARNLLAKQLRSLWGYPGLRRDLADIARHLNSQAPWPKGWQAIRMVRQYDYRDGTPKRGPNDIGLLEGLEEELRPAALADRIRAYVLGIGFDQFSLVDEFDPSDSERFETAAKRLSAIAFSLGAEAADAPAVIANLSKELFSTAAGRQFDFGKGLVSKSGDPEGLWNCLVGNLEKIPNNYWHHALLAGVLEAIRSKDSSLADRILDMAVDNGRLRQAIVFLQCAVALDRPAASRLLRSLDFEDTPLEQFGYLAWSQFPDSLAEADLCSLMSKVLDRPGGASVVIECLSNRFYSLDIETSGIVSSRLKGIVLRAAQQWFLDHAGFEGCRPLEDYHLEKVMRVCIDGKLPEQESDEVFDAFFIYLKGPQSTLTNLNQTLNILVTADPFRFLDGAFLQEDDRELIYIRLFGEGILKENPLSYIDTTDLLFWCRQGDCQRRLATLAKHIFPFSEDEESGDAMLSEQARAILDEAEDVSKILMSYARSIRSRICWDSPVGIVARRLKAFEKLLDDPNHKVREAAGKLIPEIHIREEQERRWERRWAEANSEMARFE